MRTTLFLTVNLALSLLTSCGEHSPADPAETTGPAPSQQPVATSTGDPAMSTQPMIKNTGLLSYDGTYAILTDCEGDKVYMVGELMDAMLEDIKRVKADPKHTVWVVVGTYDNGKSSPDSSARVHGTGVVLSREATNPCDSARDK